MTFGEEWGWGASAETSRRIFDLFVAAGGNFVDTANVYTNGTSERLVGEFVSANRKQLVIGTKYSLSTRPDDPNGGGNHRKSLVQAIEASLISMKLDYVDILWLHAWDFLTPESEVLRALDDLVRSGKVLYTGISDTPAWVIARMDAIAELRGWTAFAGVQLPYSLLERTPEREFFPLIDALGLSLVTWGALAGGLLSGKHRGKPASERSGRMLLQQADSGDGAAQLREDRIVDVLCRIAEKLGLTPAQAAMAWAKGRPVPIIPIVGARTEEQMKDNLRCLAIELPEEDIETLDAASAIELGFPHDFLRSPAMRSSLFGSTEDSLDMHGPLKKHRTRKGSERGDVSYQDSIG